MKRFFFDAMKTASAFCTEASFACVELNSALMDTALVSISLIISLMGQILSVKQPSLMREHA